jgi:phosphoglucosamine mutase
MVMPVRFGTDGIRGRASDEITVDLAYRLGRAVASVFSVPIYVGYDTRESSPALAARSWPGFATVAPSASTSATSRRRVSR